MADDRYNPIRAVDGRPIPCPSTYVYNLSDVSAPDAGRTEDVTMHKKRVGQVISLELEWQNITTEECSRILKAFDSEYITVNYLDAKAGGYVTDEFYVGDRTSPLYNARLGLWSNVNFNIIRRRGAVE